MGIAAVSAVGLALSGSHFCCTRVVPPQMGTGPARCDPRAHLPLAPTTCFSSAISQEPRFIPLRFERPM